LFSTSNVWEHSEKTYRKVDWVSVSGSLGPLYSTEKDVLGFGRPKNKSHTPIRLKALKITFSNS